MIERIKIILLCIAGAVVYGLVHDQVTAHVCVEYFSDFHPAVFWDSHVPWILGVEWGVIATWWVGFFLGVPLGICCTVGKWPRVTWRELVLPLTIGLALLGCTALLFGLAGYKLESGGVQVLVRNESDFLRPDRWALFAFDKFSHLASYGFGVILGIVMCVWAVRKRLEKAKSGVSV